ncbi:MAG: hypothetical protein DRQ97_01440 [Gammaproteobacteria bacterium]|nr:MAG: hypothetical protein DRQ97_01440 [Gammaproteobacteria bacterium]
MAIDLVSYLSGEGESPRLWIDFDAYTKKLLLGEGDSPWTTPATYMSYYSQAHGLVKADVVVLNVWDMFQHWMREDEEAIPAMAGKRRVTVALKTMLGAYQPRELLAEVITALGNNYGQSVPMVLVMPSPRSLLVKAHKAANEIEVEPDEMSVDTASMYVADYLRYFSEADLSGILLLEDPELMPATGEELSWYQPVYNVAKHYRWSVGVHLPVVDDSFNVPDDIAFVVVPAQSASMDNALGVDITQPLWEAAGVDGLPIREAGFYYLSIPADAKPETVLETLADLKA